MTYPDSVQFLYAIGNELRSARLDLGRMTAMLEALGHPERGGRYVHVAGTNGKGSTCAMIEAGLRAAGLRTGLYTSPHLVEPTERIRLNGRPVSRDDFAAAFNRIHTAAVRLADGGGIDTHPTYFETVTLMALLLFREKAADIAVMEVGLGGRLDATNVITPEVCAITPIDFDHENILGSSLAAIAGEKAGILKRGVRAVIAPQRAEALERIKEAAAKAGAPLTLIGEGDMEGVDLDARGCRFTLRREGRAIPVECPLAGEHQVVNAATAAAVLDLLKVSPEGIAAARWPGRLECVSEAPEIILDGAHNPGGARALAAYLDRFYAHRRVWIVYATMRDKSVDEIAELLSSRASELVLTKVDSTRALRPEAMAGLFRHPRLRLTGSVGEAIEVVRREAAAEDAVFITGSLFLVGEARALLAGSAGSGGGSGEG